MHHIHHVRIKLFDARRRFVRTRFGLFNERRGFVLLMALHNHCVFEYADGMLGENARVL
jgi:hypothetical protein